MKQLSRRVTVLEAKAPSGDGPRHIIIVSEHEDLAEAQARYAETHQVNEGDDWFIIQLVGMDMSRMDAERGQIDPQPPRIRTG